jgi:hypothetical protein
MPDDIQAVKRPETLLKYQNARPLIFLKNWMKFENDLKFI